MMIHYKPFNILTLIGGIFIFLDFLVNVNALQACPKAEGRKRATNTDTYCIETNENSISIFKIEDSNKGSDQLTQLKGENNANKIFYFNTSGNFVSDVNGVIAEGYICSDSSCTEIKQEGYYLNSENGKLVVYYSGSNSEFTSIKGTGVYLNGDNSTNGLPNALIVCDGTKCETKEGKSNETYLNSGSDGLKNALIKCDDSGCSVSNACETSDYEYFLDAGNTKTVPAEEKRETTTTTTTTTSAIIVCSKKSEKCESYSSPSGYYLNYGSDNTANPLILCETKENKIECKSTISSGINVYYINSGDANSIIFCSTATSCTIFTSPNGDFFYISDIGKGDGTDALIYCDDGKCNLESITSAGYYLTRTNESTGLIKCTAPGTDAKASNPCSMSTPSTFTGYFINADPGLKTTYPLIKCTSEGCQALKIGSGITPGFYFNAGDETDANKIIACDENKCDISKYESGKEVNGCYTLTDSKELKLFVGMDQTEDGFSAVSSDIDDTNALYYFVDVEKPVFPSINSKVSVLFKISKYSLTRVIVDGTFAIESNTHKISEKGSVGSEVDLYSCTAKTKICNKRSSCIVNTYLLDKLNGIAYYCKESNTLEKVTEPGYYIDSSHGTTAYVINCEAQNGSLVCEYVASPKNYFINAGYDKATNPLIYCDNTNCHNVDAEIGNYLSGVVIGHNRSIIKCTSTTNCSVANSIKSMDHYYINNGADKISKPLINCYNKNCAAITASIGNYITEDTSILIKCETYSNCYTFSASAGFYNYAFYNSNGGAKKKIIECELKLNVVCEPKEANSGFYVSNTSNVLINCTGNGDRCTTTVARNGIFRSATTRVTTTSRKRDDNVDVDVDAGVVEHEGRVSKTVYNIIVCTASSCNELSASELAAIPYCTFDNNKCFINTKLPTISPMVSSIAAGGYCTNSDREVFYFATDTIVTETDILYGSTSIYTYTTTNTNCIKVSNAYAKNYFTINDNIYHIDEGQITQIINSGYYFINIHTNTLVSGTDIDDYNDENVKLFKCNDNSCMVVDKPNGTTYIADVNKRILKYNPNSDNYAFAYEEDIICQYSNNKCTPRSDLKNQEFCITYKGELVLAGSSIKSRETGDCYKSSSINTEIYGYSSQYLYAMTTNLATVVDETAFYLVSLSSNTTATFKDFKNRNNPIKVYGCNASQCNEVVPTVGVYYYDPKSKYLFTHRDGTWTSPTESGFALVSVNPSDVYVYGYTVAPNTNKVTLNYRASEGYYFTDDEEMYHCDENNNVCTKVDHSGYYFTNHGEIYYCLYDSEGLEKISCVKQSCYIGQFYYIEEKYYRCESGSYFTLVSSKYCKHDENVIINFFTAYSEEYPDRVRNAINGISENNNSTAVVSGMNKNYMSIVPGVFTNCTYNVEDHTSTFDLVCINNYVSYNKKSDDYEICSVSQLGYIECVEDENNANKCNISGALSRYSKKLSTVVIVLVASLFYLFA